MRGARKTRWRFCAAGTGLPRRPRGCSSRRSSPRAGGDVALARDLLERSGLAKDGVASAQLLSALIDLQQENYAIAAVTFDRLYARQPDNSPDPRSAGLCPVAQRGRARAGPGLPVSWPTIPHRPICAHWSAALTKRWATAPTLRGSSISRRLHRASRAAEPFAGTLIAPTSQATGALQLQGSRCAMSIIAGDGEAAVTRAAELARRFPGSADAQAVLGDASWPWGTSPPRARGYGRAARVRQSWPLALRLARAQDDVPRAQRMLADYVRQTR